jgi:histidinol-phosphatase
MNSTAADLESRLEWAIEIARRGGKSTLQYFRHPQLAVDLKGDSSPVTVADRNAEQLLRDLIHERFPADGIVGEEFGTAHGTSPYTWVLDPIDGTKSFIYGVPLYTTLVAVLSTPDGEPTHGTPEIGVICAPALDELTYARRGEPTWYIAGKKLPVRAQIGKVSRLEDALLLTSEVATFETHRDPPALDVFLDLQKQVRLVRTWGDAYGYMMVALGRGDVMIDASMSLWDAAAIQPIIEGAGGVFCDWKGVATVHSGEAIAASEPLMEQVLGLTRGK